MYRKIQLLLTVAAHLDHNGAADLFRAFGALLAADEGFITYKRQCLRPRTGKRPSRFHHVDNGIHPHAAEG